MARQGSARLGVARLGLARQGEVCNKLGMEEIKNETI